MRDLIVACCLLGGALLALVAGIGLLRLPDIYARMHAVTKPATLGLALICVGAALEMNSLGSAVKVLFSALLAFLGPPVASHMIGRAAHRSGNEVSHDTVRDDYAQIDSLPADSDAG